MRSDDALRGSTAAQQSLPASLRTEATPALVLDRDVLIANIEAMAERARAAGVALWPHAKTHKCAPIARLQREHGAAGITVATLTEAEYFVAKGLTELLLAYPPVGSWRLERLTSLAQHARVRVVLSDVAVLAALIEACRAAEVVIPFLWEVDCGAGRLGTAPGEATAAAIARASRAPECPFGGLMTFGGHAYGAADDAGLDRAAEDERAALRTSADALQAIGIPCHDRIGCSSCREIVFGEV
jgi:D-serine deaminase-like pyridoxal phosphate-dependent protein